MLFSRNNKQEESGNSTETIKRKGFMAFDKATTISEGSKIEGKLFFPNGVNINGEVRGEIESQGTIIIGVNARVEAQVTTKAATVSGYFKGSMTAENLVEIKPSGKFYGELVQENYLLTVEKGGLFCGKSVSSSGNGVEDESWENLKKF
jgi:cytoskeletal protein CcmA (bactofilin family)